MLSFNLSIKFTMIEQMQNLFMNNLWVCATVLQSSPELKQCIKEWGKHSWICAACSAAIWGNAWLWFLHEGTAAISLLHLPVFTAQILTVKGKVTKTWLRSGQQRELWPFEFFSFNPPIHILLGLPPPPPPNNNIKWQINTLFKEIGANM